MLIVWKKWAGNITMAAFFQDVLRLFEKKMFVAGWIWGKILWVIILDF